MTKTQRPEDSQQPEDVVAVVGLGYVGLPVALAFAEAGLQVQGYDIRTDWVARLNRGDCPIDYIGPERLREALAHNRFQAFSAWETIAGADAIILCLPTPLGPHREPDLSAISQSLAAIAPHLRPQQLLVLESTTYPGTTRDVIAPVLIQQGFVLGHDFFLAYSPERINPGSPVAMRAIPKLVGGLTVQCREKAVALYRHVVDRVVPVSSPEVAELAKLLENIYRAVNIGLVNEMSILAHKMGLSIHEVIAAAATKPFGYQAFEPGPGLGGHCVPIDPFYLTWKASEFGIHTRFIELAGEVNSAMPAWVVQCVQDALNELGRPLKGSRVLVLGIAYKKNIDDPRESPAIEIMHLLREKGAIVEYSDPHIPVFPAMKRYQFDLQSVPFTRQTLREADAIVLATDHDAFDYALVRAEAKCLIDPRGRLQKSVSTDCPPAMA